MAGLKLKLRPEEQILINGAVVQNGRHQVELTIKTPNTNILRLRDAIHPEDANTPVKRVCYIAQMVVAGEATIEQAADEFIPAVQALQKVFLDEGSQNTMHKALEFAQESNFYKAMQSMRKLIKYEEALLMKQVINDLPRTAEQIETDRTFYLLDNNEEALKELHQQMLDNQDGKRTA